MTISPSSTQRAGSCASKGSINFRKVTVERLLVAALNQDLVAIAKHQGAKAIPLRLEDPAIAIRQLAHSFCEHWQHRRINREPHLFHAIPAGIRRYAFFLYSGNACSPAGI